MPDLGYRSLYKAFISYSHADDRLAPALQRGLETLGKSWYRRSALKIFRDETSLAANPGPWSSIEQNLARSAFFVLVASTDAVRSPWVEREAAWWRAHRSMERVLIAVANGAIVWDAQTGDFDWTRTTCLPAALARGLLRSRSMSISGGSSQARGSRCGTRASGRRS